MTPTSPSHSPEPTVKEAKKAGLALVCPIRGSLKVLGTTKDGLRPSEEARRVEAIKYLLSQGYPPEHILIEPIVRRIGHGGRNSLRADLAVTDLPAAEVKVLPVNERVKHARILGEVKRDSGKSAQTRETQVEPLLAFGPPGCLAIYWDEEDQILLWHDEKKQLCEGDLSALPRWGEGFTGAERLTLEKLRKPKNLKRVFERIADVLHAQGVEERKRFEVVLQLLLTKMWDERLHEAEPDAALDIQDPLSLDLSPDVAVANFNLLLRGAAAHYNQLLPEPLEDRVKISPTALVEALHILAPWRIAGHSGSAIQALYMWFAKKLYRRELAEYFTPPRLTEFIVRLAAPQQHESIKDPAVGSADFLMAAERLSPAPRDGIARLYGADISDTGVMAARVNALLHDAAGITQIEKVDSLAEVDGPSAVTTAKDASEKGRFHIVITNPPFGTSIVIQTPAVLAKFDLGHEWVYDEDGGLVRTDNLLKSQEAGILFVEAALRQVLNDGGRVAIILPNGYLGNRSTRYHALREWVLRHARVAAIVGFPRFTFKGSGADVSASVLLLERRAEPLEDSAAGEDYPVAVEMLERLGWNVGVKKEADTFKRDPRDGSLIVDSDGVPIPDDDYGLILARIAASAAADEFGWLAKGYPQREGEDGWTVPISQVLTDPARYLDPKRLCRKYFEIREHIAHDDHFRMGDLVEVIPQMTATQVGALSASKVYDYVEIQDVGPGIYSPNKVRGWQLPSRARHVAQPGDVFVGGIWGSVSKWFVAGPEEELLVTNGFHRLRIKQPERLVDLAAGLCTEAFAVQMRALARGSDGLAEVTEDDLVNVVLPVIPPGGARDELQGYVDQLLHGHTSVRAAVSDLVRTGALPFPAVSPRPSHVVLV
ncbi:MAG: N-6 DNA methylase [Rubrobacteraceae bacterium]